MPQSPFFFGFIVLIVGLVLVFVQVSLAIDDDFFTPKQMVKYHLTTGLPLQWHFGIFWGDLFVITPLCAVVVAKYGDQWSGQQILVTAIVAMALSALMHYQYLQDNIPNSHMHDGRLTPAAYVHFVFMWAAMTIVGLFFLSTAGLTPQIVIPTAILLWLHVVFGTHLIVKLWSPPWFPPNQPPADTITLVVWSGAAIGLAWLSWWALR